MIYEWFMVICLYAYVASSLGKALPLWRRRRRINLSGTRAERDEATFAAYAATWSALAIAFAAFAAIVITSPDNQFVDVVRVEGTSPSGTPTAVAPPSPPAAPVVTPSPSSSRLAAFVAAVPQPKGPSAETAPRTTSRLAEFVAAVPSR